MKTILTITLLLLLAGATSGQSTEPPPWLISSRLVRIPIDELAGYLKADSSFTAIPQTSLFYPEISDVIEIDRNLIGSLKSFSKETRLDRPLFGECVREWIAETSYCYGGQFFGYTNKDRQRIIVCTYQFISDLGEFQNSTEIAWPGDATIKNEYAGSVFQFQYNLESKQTSSFKINDAKEQLFGTKKLESLGFPELPTRPFILNKEKNFSIQLGRGSGWKGIELIKIDNKGNVQLHKLNGEHTRFNLTAEELDAIVRSANREKLTELERKYVDEDIQDGTQWLLWVRQNGKQTTVLFSNQFPEQITRFAKTVDLQLRTGERNLKFQAAKDRQGHARRIWDISSR